MREDGPSKTQGLRRSGPKPGIVGVGRRSGSHLWSVFRKSCEAPGILPFYGAFIKTEWPTWWVSRAVLTWVCATIRPLSAKRLSRDPKCGP